MLWKRFCLGRTVESLWGNRKNISGKAAKGSLGLTWQLKLLYSAVPSRKNVSHLLNFSVCISVNEVDPICFWQAGVLERKRKMLRELVLVIPVTVKLCSISLGKVRDCWLSTAENRLTSHVVRYILKGFFKHKAKNHSLTSMILYD